MNFERRWWASVFLAVAFAFQISLFFLGGIAAFRLPLRTGVYGMSLAFAFFIPGRSRPTPAWAWAQGAIALLIVAAVHPEGDSLIARIAGVTLLSSVLVPLLWIGRLPLRASDFRVALRIMWAFYTLSAAMGVLQVSYPGRFDGSLSANYADRKSLSFQMHIMELADGRKVIRPMGLTDVPGGAGTGGVNAIILGTGLLLTEASLLLRGAAITGMVCGLFCVYIVQERTNLIITGLATAVLMGVLLKRQSFQRVATLATVAVGVMIVGTAVAFATGGDRLVDRFATLVADDPHTVFQKNRGMFLEELITHELVDFPLGAGLGHWGMVNTYFGSPATSLYAEMLWQALGYDGGIPLILAYLGLFGTLMWTALRIALGQRSDTIGCWAGVVLGYDVTAFAASFVFPNMAMQIGMEIILLNALLYAVGKDALAASLPQRQHRSRNVEPAHARPAGATT